MTVSQYVQSCPLSKKDTDQIICYVLDFSQSQLILNRNQELSDEQINTLNGLVQKRQTGLALAYVLQQRAFYRDVFYCPQGVLIPQPDTETLVEEAIKEALKQEDKKTIDVLDLCAGTGCVGISVAKELSKYYENVNLTLSDISPKAYEVFSVNVQKIILQNNVKVYKNLGDLFEKLNQKYDLIVSNPPYINTEIIPTLDAEVQQEPLLALDGGKDGLTLIKKIVSNSKNFAKPKCHLLVEIGYDQGHAVFELFTNNKLSQVKIVKDLSLCDRVVKGCF